MLSNPATWITEHVAGKFLLVCNTQRWQRFKASTAQQFQSSWLLFVDEYTVRPIPPSQLPNSKGREHGAPRRSPICTLQNNFMTHQVDPDCSYCGWSAASLPQEHFTHCLSLSVNNNQHREPQLQLQREESLTPKQLQATVVVVWC